mgnify:CR=1 FL=1
MEAWRNFKGEKWKKIINVDDFIKNNYSEYLGDDSFLQSSTEKTNKLLEEYEKLKKKELEKGILDVDVTCISGINNYKPGYINSLDDVIVGLQTDEPLKRIVNPFGGMRMVKSALDAYGYELSEEIDKYFQIAPCFRDEDCRADRTLEFYQLDFEMAFATEEDVYRVGEEIFYDTFTHFSDKEVSPRPFRRIPYKEAMLKYGTDKPDLRNPLEIIDLTEEFKETTFKPFQKSIIRGIKVDNLADKSNSWFNEVVDYASSIGMPGIGYISVMDDMSFKGPIDKFLTEEERKELIEKASLEKGSVLFFIANRNENIAANFAGQIRTCLGKKLDLIDPNKFEFCIINDMPMFEYNAEENKYDFGHNPFSMPQGGEKAYEKNIEDIMAYQYDFVCNGYEMSSGAVRNHNIELLMKGFNLVGYSEETVKDKFKSLYTAFQYGVPPHAGMAPGIDRIIMLLKDEPNLREVQAFPPNVSGQDNMMGSPSEISEKQLREVHIKIR